MSSRIITLRPVQLSFVKLFTPEKKKKKVGNQWIEDPDSKLYYSVELRVPKSDSELIKQIQGAVNCALEEARVKRWGGTIPLIERKNSSFRDGDIEKPGKEEYKGMMFISCKAPETMKPGLLDYKCDAFKNRLAITDPVDLYSGCWAFVSISFYGYANLANGVNCTIHNVLKFKGAPAGFSDERLAGGPSAEEDFQNFATPADDDDFMN